MARLRRTEVWFQIRALGTNFIEFGCGYHQDVCCEENPPKLYKLIGIPK